MSLVGAAHLGAWHIL